MGRQQVQPALRQAVQQQSANPKLQQQQFKQQSRPTTASTPVANNTMKQQQQQKTASRPQSAASQAQTQVKQQPKQQQAQSQQLKSNNAQVYRPTPVKEHPDDAFLSGAWMFDQSRVPQWMSSQLPTQQQKSASPKSTQQQQLQQSKQMKQQQQQQPVSRPTSSSPTPVKQQMSKNTINAQVYRPSPVKEHVDDAFNSGAWLFDESRVPQWMAPHLPKMQQKAQQQRSATPKSAQTRPTSMPTQQQAAKPAVQQKQQQHNLMQPRQQFTQPKQQKQLPTMQHGDDTFLWNGWTQASRQPLWSNSNTGSTTTSMKPATMNAAARPQSPPAKQAQPQQSQGQKRPQSPARR